jgi:hypothetical protein
LILRMSLSENRFPLFRDMRELRRPSVIPLACAQSA